MSSIRPLYSKCTTPDDVSITGHNQAKHLGVTEEERQRRASMRIN